MSELTDPSMHGLPPISRRVLLGLGAAGIAVGAAALTSSPASATSEGTVLPLVDPLPDGAPDRSSFAPHEQVFAPYLMIVAALANSVRDIDPNYGWMEDGWWRTPNDPLNSRIQEHVATLAWFATHERDWNPYYLDENLIARLDAALGYYLSLQGPRGAWPVTYEAESLATTGFGMVALAHTFRNLASLDLLPERRAEMEPALRAAATWMMDLNLPHWDTPIHYHNQNVGGLAGVGHASTVLGDPTIAADLKHRTSFLTKYGHAPAGYFLEGYGFDFGYNSSVALPDLADLYTQTGDPVILKHVRTWADFIQYVLLPEPNSSGFTVMGQACLRGATSVHAVRPDDNLDRAALARVFIEHVPLLAPMHAAAEDKAAFRAAWADDGAPVAPRKKGDTSPRLFDHVPKAPENVSAAEREAILATWRPVAESTFTEYREGTIDQQMLFVRRPGYYLATLIGVRRNSMPRTGPGLLWHPAAGSLIASFNSAADDHWSTVLDGGTDAGLTDVTATFHDGLDSTAPTIAPADLAGRLGAFTSRYVSAASGVSTDVVHLPDGVVRDVTAPGSAVEMIPLFIREGDAIELSDGTTASFGDSVEGTATWLSVTRGTIRLQLSWETPLPVTVTATGRTYFPEKTHTHAVVRVAHAGSIRMEATYIDLDEVADRVPFTVASETIEHDGEWRTLLHVTNVDTEPIDVRFAGGAAGRTLTGIAPGQAGLLTFTSNGRTSAPGIAIARTTSGRPRTGRLTFEV